MVKNTKSKSWWSVMLDDIFILHPDCFLFAKKHCTFSVLENWSNCLEKLTTAFFLWLCKLNHQPFGRLQCICCVQEKSSHSFLIYIFEVSYFFCLRVLRSFILCFILKCHQGLTILIVLTRGQGWRKKSLLCWITCFFTETFCREFLSQYLQQSGHCSTNYLALQ